jgi:hypothetical protein
MELYKEYMDPTYEPQPLPIPTAASEGVDDHFWPNEGEASDEMRESLSISKVRYADELDQLRESSPKARLLKRKKRSTRNPDPKYAGCIRYQPRNYYDPTQPRYKQAQCLAGGVHT